MLPPIVDPEEPPQLLPPRRLEGSIIFGSDVSGWQDTKEWFTAMGNMGEAIPFRFVHQQPPIPWPDTRWLTHVAFTPGDIHRLPSEWRSYGMYMDTEPSIHFESLPLGDTDERVVHAWWVGNPRGLAKISLDTARENLLSANAPLVYESEVSEKVIRFALVHNSEAAYLRYDFIARTDGRYWFSYVRHVFEQEWLPEFRHRVSYPILRWMNKRGLAYTPEGCIMSWRDIGKKKPKEHRVIATTRKLLVNKYKDLPDEQRDELLRDFNRSYHMALEGRVANAFGVPPEILDIDKNRTISEESDAADAWKFLKSSLTKMPADYRGESRRIDILGEVGQAKDDGE